MKLMLGVYFAIFCFGVSLAVYWLVSELTLWIFEIFFDIMQGSTYLLVAVDRLVSELTLWIFEIFFDIM